MFGGEIDMESNKYATTLTMVTELNYLFIIQIYEMSTGQMIQYIFRSSNEKNGVP